MIAFGHKWLQCAAEGAEEYIECIRELREELQSNQQALERDEEIIEAMAEKVRKRRTERKEGRWTVRGVVRHDDHQSCGPITRRHLRNRPPLLIHPH